MKIKLEVTGNESGRKIQVMVEGVFYITKRQYKTLELTVGDSIEVTIKPKRRKEPLTNKDWILGGKEGYPKRSS